MIWVIVFSALALSVVVIICHMYLLIIGSGADDQDGGNYNQSSRQQETTKGYEGDAVFSTFESSCCRH